MQQCLPIPLTKAKFRSFAESAGEADDDVVVAAPNEGDSKDGDLEVPFILNQPLEDQIHALTMWFDAYGCTQGRDSHHLLQPGPNHTVVGSAPLFSHSATPTVVILKDVSLFPYFPFFH